MALQVSQVTGKGASIAGVVAVLAIVSLGLQYVLVFNSARATVGLLAGTVGYFSYFTILANLVVAAVSVAAALRPAGTGFFSGASVRGAAAVYIGVTMAVYDSVLRPLWDPTGAQLWADIGLHYFVPIAYLTWWLWWAPHGTLRMRDVAWWMLLPAAFLGWTLVRGSLLHTWPYPFLDVDALGAGRVARNAAAVLGMLVGVGAAVFGVDRILGTSDHGADASP